jgi:hypothetical protein
MNEKEYKCDICVKTYSSYQSLWNHTKKTHKNTKTTAITENTEPTAKFDCRICGKCYKYKQSRYFHEKSCSGVPPVNAELEIERLKTINFDKEQETIRLKTINFDKEQKLIESKIKLQEMQAEDDNTVKSINKLLDNTHIAINGNNNNVMNNSNNTTNNITNINITFPSILGYGVETQHLTVAGTLTEQDKYAIINSFEKALDKIVEIVQCGERDSFKNVIITNLTKKYAYKYDESVKNFTKVDKSWLLNDMIYRRTQDLETIYEEFVDQKKISNDIRIIFKKQIDNLNDKDTMTYDDNNNYVNLKTNKLNALNELLYINRHKIMDDIKEIIQNWGDNNKKLVE